MEEQHQSKQSLKLKLGAFEGPLDLLLHLINKLEIDIYDIPIAEVTDQYMEHLRQMQEVQIDVAADYFVMAATLMRIKSEMLVPRNEHQAEMEDYQEEEDPRQPLIELIVEYKQIKEVVPKFENRIEDRANYFGKDPADISKFRETIELKDQGLSAEDLSSVFMDVLKRYELETPQPTTIKADEVTVVERMDDIKNRIMHSQKKKINFTQLIENPSRQEIVVTFLALLELIKDNSVRVLQENLRSDISISFIDDPNIDDGEKKG